MTGSKAEWFDQTRANAHRIEQEIDSLASGHWHMLQRDYPAFWRHAKEISSLFKELKPILHNDHERLWKQFRSVCNETRERQDHEDEVRLGQSELKRNLIRDRLKEAYGWAHSAESEEHLARAQQQLDQTLEMMKDGWAGFTGSTEFFEELAGNEGRLTRKDRDLCWSEWREAKQALRERRKLLWEENYSAMRRQAGSAWSKPENGDPYEALTLVKEARGDLKGTGMSRAQREEIGEILDKAWEAAISRINERRAERERKHEASALAINSPELLSKNNPPVRFYYFTSTI